MSPDPAATPLAATTVVPTVQESTAIVHPSASYSIRIRARLPQRPGAFGQVATTIGNTGAIVGAIDLVQVEESTKVREITVACIDSAHGECVVDAVREIDSSPSIVVRAVTGGGLSSLTASTLPWRTTGEAPLTRITMR